MVTVNAGGATGTWRVLDAFCGRKEDSDDEEAKALSKTYDFICIQVIAMNEKEAEAFGRVAKSKG